MARVTFSNSELKFDERGLPDGTKDVEIYY